jgi:two-component system response regulator FlrC
VTDNKMIDVLWFDSHRLLSSVEVAEFAEQGLAITQVDGIESDNAALFSAQLLVVSLVQSTQDLKQLQVRLTAAKIGRASCRERVY